jgi:hypothetical protein
MPISWSMLVCGDVDRLEMQTQCVYLARRSLLMFGVSALLGANQGCLSTRGTPLSARDVARDLSATSHTGVAVSLEQLTRDGPAVVVFYRGYW